MSHPIRIVGAGLAGMTLGHRLVSMGYPVVIHEAASRPGGLASRGKLAGVEIDRFYHCILPQDRILLDLFSELGLSDQIIWNRTRTGFFTGSRLLEMTTRRDFLTFEAIGLLDRMRLAWTLLYCGRFRDPHRFENESVGDFLKRHGGRRLFEIIWEPLLLSKLGPEYDRFSAAFIWATIQRMMSARKAKGQAEMLGYFAPGYQRLFERLSESIQERGGSIVCEQPISSLTRDGGDPDSPWMLHCADQRLAASAVIFCTPAPVTARCLQSAFPEQASRMMAIEDLGVICEALLLKRPLTPYYVLNLLDKSLPFTAVVETSNLAGTSPFEEHHLAYLPRYRDQSSPMWEEQPDRIHAENMQGLLKVVPDLQESDILDWKIYRERHVQPIHGIGGSRNVPPITLADGVAMFSTAHVYPWPVFNDEILKGLDCRMLEILTTLDLPRRFPDRKDIRDDA